MNIFESIGQVIGAMSKPHTSTYIVFDRHGGAHKIEAIYPEQAVDIAVRKVKHLERKNVRGVTRL